MRAAQHVRNLRLGWRRPQPLRLDRPEHAALAMAPQHREHRRVHHAPGRAEERRRRAGEIAEQILRPRDLGLGAARATEPEARVRPAPPAYPPAAAPHGAPRPPPPGRAAPRAEKAPGWP